MRQRPNRVLVIGLDCAPPELVFDQFRNQLPNLSRLMAEGIYGKLESTIPAITVPAWTGLFASKNPGELGFFGFRNRKPGTYHDMWIATSSAVRVDRVWDIASRAGKQCVVLGVPQTYPPRPLNGLMVTCFLTPSIESQYTYPPELKQEIAAVVGEYILDAEGFRTEDKGALLRQIYDMTAKRFALARHFLQTKPWDLFIMVEMGPDRLHHGFWKYGDPQHRKYEPGNPYENATRDYYIELDREIGELLALVDDDVSVIVCSDHGAKRMDGSFNVNDWLLQTGYLTLSQPVTEPTEVKKAPIDWSRTKAWGLGGYYARVFLNVQGREPEGIIAPAEYERVRDQLVADLQAIPDDTGRVMATRAIKPQDVYTGPYIPEAPDLIVYFDDLYWRAGGMIGNASLYSFDTEIGPDDAVHSQYGLFILRTPGGPSGERVSGLRIYDGAPTILSLLGLPVPADMEGRAVHG
jgi:predicted AlkP superfamily phosphohydrolase/phosphomutase